MTGIATTTTAKPKQVETGTRLFGLLAEFETPAEIMHAAEKTRAAGYRWWDCMTPFPVHGLDKAMGIRPTILPWLVLGGGLTGVTVALVLQAFTNASSFNVFFLPGIMLRGYDFLISGKPLNSLPAWIPVMFELTILLSSLGCVGFMLLLNGLPRLYHPCFKSKRFQRVTDDRFFLLIEARDPLFYRDKAEVFLNSLNPVSIEALED